MGYDLCTREPIESISNVLDCMRQQGFLVIHTRESYRPDLADCPPARLWRTQQSGAGIGSDGPCGRLLVEGELGWDIIPELTPLPSEIVIDKPARGAFVGTSLDLILRCKGVQNIILTGVTTDVCVHSTMRHADDLGFECLLLKVCCCCCSHPSRLRSYEYFSQLLFSQDCCAATNLANHKAAIEMVKEEGGVFGAVADSTALIDTLQSISGSK